MVWKARYGRKGMKREEEKERREQKKTQFSRAEACVCSAEMDRTVEEEEVREEKRRQEEGELCVR